MLLATLCAVALGAAVFGHIIGDADPRRHRVANIVLVVFIALAIIFAGPNLFYWLLSLVAFYFF